MKKLLISFVFSFILVFSFSLNVSAECSYKERTQLLNEANKIEIFFEPIEEVTYVDAKNPNSGEIDKIEIETIYFKMNITNVADDLYLKVINQYNGEEFFVNSGDLNNGIFSHRIDDINNVYNFKVEINASNSNCYGKNINTKIIKKPKFNPVSQYSICYNEYAYNSKYCEKFIDSEFDMNDIEIVDYLNSLVEKEIQNSVVEKDLTFLDIVKTYWYVPVFILFVTISVILIVVVKRKRGELK